MQASTPLRRRTRPQLKGDGREAALLAAGEAMLGEGRFDDASVAELAAAAGVSRPTFYFYFASKDALMASLVDATHAEIAARLEAALGGDGPPTERLAAAMRAGADAWWSHRAVMAAAMELAHRVPQLGVRMLAAMDGANALCTEMLLVHGTVAEGDDPAAAAALVRTLALLNERVFAFEVTAARRRADLRPAERRLLTIWVRTLGLREPETTASR
jgi:AcrR family transcriptional regulator